MSKLNRNQTNPITLEELAGDLALVAAKNGLDPQELSEANYFKLGGKFRSKATWQRKGGFGKIRATLLPDEDKDLKSISSLGKTASYINKLESAVGSKLNLQEKIEEVVKNLNIKVTKKSKSKKVRKGTDKVHVVAMLNDTHIGQIIDSEEIGGLNSFDFKEAGRRVAMFIKEVGTYKNYKRDQVETFHLALNGDLAAGIIHNLESKSQHLLIHQMNGLLHILVNAIEYLRTEFGAINVYGIAGNHDRMIHKNGGKRANGEEFDSYANIAFYALSAIFKDAKDIKFSFPKTPYVFMDLPAGRAMVAHGHNVFSKALGNIGKSINVKGLTDAIRDFNAGEIAKGNKPIKLLLMGHVHNFGHFTSVDGVEVVIAPSLSGIDAFAHNLTINSSTAAQVVFESTPKFVLGDMRLIRLHEADKDESLDKIIPEYKKELKHG